MDCGKVRLLLFIGLLLLPSGCGTGARNEVGNSKDDVACVSRADLRLNVAAMTRDVDAMETALKSGANVDSVIEGLGPPIVVSALVDNNKAVQLLLDKGAKINATDPQGYTALINASLLNHLDMARLLISRGADVNMRSDLVVNGKKAPFTPLMIAKLKGHQDIVKLLTEAGAKQ